MEKSLKRSIDEKVKLIDSHLVNKDWFYDFFELIEENGYKGNLKDILDLVFQNPNLILKNDSKEPLRYIHNISVCKKRGTELLDFLSTKLKGLPLEESQAMLDEMLDFVKENTTGETFFGNLLAKYLSLKFSDEIQVDTENADLRNPEEDLKIYAKLGNFKIAALDATYYEDLGLSIHEIRTLKNLTSQRIGLMIFQNFFRIVDKNYPQQEDLVVQNVIKKNVGAQRFYERLGGEFYTRDGKCISREDIQSLEEHSSTNVFYDKVAIKALANAEDVRPLDLNEYIAKQQKNNTNEINLA